MQCDHDTRWLSTLFAISAVALVPAVAHCADPGAVLGRGRAFAPHGRPRQWREPRPEQSVSGVEASPPNSYKRSWSHGDGGSREREIRIAVTLPRGVQYWSYDTCSAQPPSRDVTDRHCLHPGDRCSGRGFAPLPRSPMGSESPPTTENRTGVCACATAGTSATAENREQRREQRVS